MCSSAFQHLVIWIDEELPATAPQSNNTPLLLCDGPYAARWVLQESQQTPNHPGIRQGSRGGGWDGTSGLTGFSAGFSAPFLDFLPPRLALLRPISSSASTSFFLNTCARMPRPVSAALFTS